MPLFIDCGDAAGHLETTYRAELNGERIPYWVAVCHCGWRGEPKYFRGYAANDLREHLEETGHRLEAGAATDRGGQSPRALVRERAGERTAA